MLHPVVHAASRGGQIDDEEHVAMPFSVTMPFMKFPLTGFKNCPLPVNLLIRAEDFPFAPVLSILG